jgi:NADH:ubiquinone oxidoreductase subunit K
MNRHPAIGALSIIASVPPLWMATGLILGFGVSPGSWIFLLYAVPGGTVLAAGLLLLLGLRRSYLVGIVGWALLVLGAAFNLAVSWWSYAPGSVFPVAILLTEVIYVAVGIAVIVALARRQRSGTGSPSGGEVAA